MRGAVTASSQEAADAGVATLAAGGNAVDALVAAALATCVADPCNTGIGGYGGYMLAQRPGAPADCVRFPIWAPSTSRGSRLHRPYPDEGPACSAVPNVVGGLARALETFGRLSWAEASAPAIGLARDGVAANATTLRAFALHRHRPFMAECFDFEEGDGARRPRLLFRQPRLAATLETLAEKGPGWFYAGPLGELARASWSAAGVDVPLADWRGQAATVDVEEAPALEIGGVRAHAAPLGLSGSACMFATLAAAARIAGRGPLTGAEGLADLAEAMARLWQYRFAMPGGNDFAGVDPSHWVEAAIAAPRASRPIEAQPGHTAHLNAVDGDGLMAAVTFTHGPVWFGGRWALPGTGVVMNGGMHNFSRPATVARGGRLYGVSNMTPTIAEAADGTRVAIGCPGARRIPSNIAIALARHLFAGQPLAEAVSGGRLHAEDAGRAYIEEDRLDAGTRRALERRFPRVEREPDDIYFGPLTAVRRAASGGIEIALDDRATPGFGKVAA